MINPWIHWFGLNGLSTADARGVVAAGRGQGGAGRQTGPTDVDFHLSADNDCSGGCNGVSATLAVHCKSVDANGYSTAMIVAPLFGTHRQAHSSIVCIGGSSLPMRNSCVAFRAQL